jgi:hypothetical protein
MNLHEVRRDDQVAVLASSAPGSLSLYLRQAYRGAVHSGQQTLGVRALACDVGSFAELDRVEQRLRGLSAFTERKIIDLTERFEAVRGHDPDRLPLAFVAQESGRTSSSADYDEVWIQLYTMDI